MRPLRGLQETRVATREESGVLGFPSCFFLSCGGILELQPGIQASCSTGPGKSSFHSNCELELGIALETLQPSNRPATPLVSLACWEPGFQAWAQSTCPVQPVHPKGDQSWVFIGRTDVEAETPIKPHTSCSLILVMSVKRWNRPNFSPARQPHQIANNRRTALLPLPIECHLPPGTPSLGLPVQTHPPLDRTCRQTLALAWRPGRWLQVFSGCLAGCHGLPRRWTSTQPS